MGINAKGYYVCAHCGTTQIPETVHRDGLVVLLAGDTGLACSRCNTPLVHAMLDNHRVQFCETCRGILIERQFFADVVQSRRAWANGEPVTPVPPDAAELRRTMTCPKCGKAMTTDRYYGPGNVVLDRCDGCDLLWLDYGELKQIIDAPGIDRGGQPGVRPWD